SQGDLRTTDEGLRWGLSTKDLAGFAIAEPETKPAGSTALIKIAGSDAVMVNHVGKGWTIYLNTLFDQYPKQRALKFGGSSYRVLTRAILVKAAVLPPIEVLAADGSPVSQAQIARYRFSNAEILT